MVPFFSREIPDQEVREKEELKVFLPSFFDPNIEETLRVSFETKAGFINLIDNNYFLMKPL